MKQVVTRKDGITYEREMKSNNFNKIISLRINYDTYKKLEQLATDSNTSIGDIIRVAVKNFIEEI